VIRRGVDKNSNYLMVNSKEETDVYDYCL